MRSKHHLDYTGYTVLNAWVISHRDVLRAHSREELAVMAREELGMPVTTAHIDRAGKHTNLIVGKLSGRKHAPRKKEDAEELTDLRRLENEVTYLALILSTVLQKISLSSNTLDAILARRDPK